MYCSCSLNPKYYILQHLMLCTALTPYPVQYSLIVTYFQLVENILHQQTVYAVYHKQPKVIFLIYCLGVEGFQQV